jgi:hypothetical protein
MQTTRLMTCATAVLLIGPVGGCARRGDADMRMDPMTGDAGFGSGDPQEELGGTEYGSGEFAIILTGDQEPGRYCWHIGETIRVCGGTRDDSAEHQCIDGETNCLFLQPDDETREDRCWVSTTWQTVSGEALYGDCAHRDAYWSDDPAVECLYHRHCYDGASCVDYRCVCPEGADCPDPGVPGSAGPDDAGPGSHPSAPDAGRPDAGSSGGPGGPPAPPSP